MSWTVTKKLDAFAGPGEIKRKEVLLGPQVSPEEVKSREVELGFRVGLLLLQLFSIGGATDIVFVTLFRITVGTAIAWYGSCCAMPGRHCLNIHFCCSGGSPRHPWSSELAPVSSHHSSFPPLLPSGGA